MSHLALAQGPPLRSHARITTRLIAIVGILAGVLATLVAAPSAHASLGRSAHREARAMHIAMNQRGDPYRYGAAGPNAFDCSGLVYYAFRHAGFSRTPRTSSAQARFALHIRRSHMHWGDLIFFTSGGSVYHVGLFAGWSHGHRLVLHAPHSGTRVHIDRMWTNAWFPGTLRYR